jgi:hypothetical protein
VDEIQPSVDEIQQNVDETPSRVNRASDCQCQVTTVMGSIHGLIKYIDTKAKCRHLKKFNYKETLRQVFIKVYRLGDTVSHVSIFNPAL